MTKWPKASYTLHDNEVRWRLVAPPMHLMLKGDLVCKMSRATQLMSDDPAYPPRMNAEVTDWCRENLRYAWRPTWVSCDFGGGDSRIAVSQMVSPALWFESEADLIHFKLRWC